MVYVKEKMGGVWMKMRQVNIKDFKSMRVQKKKSMRVNKLGIRGYPLC